MTLEQAKMLCELYDKMPALTEKTKQALISNLWKNKF